MRLTDDNRINNILQVRLTSIDSINNDRLHFIVATYLSPECYIATSCSVSLNHVNSGIILISNCPYTLTATVSLQSDSALINKQYSQPLFRDVCPFGALYAMATYLTIQNIETSCILSDLLTTLICLELGYSCMVIAQDI